MMEKITELGDKAMDKKSLMNGIHLVMSLLRIYPVSQTEQ